MKTQKECTQCGACLNTCPVFQLYKSEEYSPKAKQQIIRRANNPETDLVWERMVALAGNCTSCERCKTACARNLSVPEALAQVRARNPQWQQYFWQEWVKRGKYLWKAASCMAPVVPNAMLPTKLAILHSAALAMKAPSALPAWLRIVPSPCEGVAGTKYMLFSGCTGSRLRPQWVEKSIRIIKGLGGDLVSANEFQCCGGTYHHAGMNDSAHKAASHNVDVWKNAGKPRIAVFCVSCLHSLRDYASMDGILSEAEAKEWLAALTPLSTILAKGRVEATNAAPAGYAYHSPCHWSGRDEDMVWLKKVLPGLNKGKANCCGFGGVLKMIKPELSKNLAEACWSEFAPEAGKSPTIAITGCSGCSMQLNAHAPKGSAVYHWLDIVE